MWWHGLVGSLVLLALTVLLASRPAIAQRLEKVARVGVLISTSPDCAASPTCRALVQRLRELGYVEGQNLRLEYRTAEGQMERLPALAAELVRLPVDVLVVSGPEATLRAARDATRTLPIVMIAVDYDPIALGYIAGLPRPGGNITGVVLQQLEVTGKCLALLKDALSQLARVAVLWDAHSADQLRVAEAAARELGVQVHALALSNPPADDFEGAFAAAVREGADALLVLRSPRFFAARAHIVALAAQHRLPAMYSSRWAVEVGGLMAYGASQGDLAPRAAEYVDKLLKGAIPATLPVEQPMKFEFVINLKTAQALGLTLPPHILVFANEVIR
jgi:putative ABC transport system substrate-binding protein